MQQELQELRQTTDLEKAQSLLSSLKLKMLKMNYLTSIEQSQDALLIREVLELGALHSIRSKDIPAFEGYFSQLRGYYHPSLPESPRMFMMIGLNLIHLLSLNRIADFHTELESLSASLENIYIKHPLQIEQCLMEGSYNKVWNSRSNVPAEEYKFFIDILMKTIRYIHAINFLRNEIASCSEKAYGSLPIQDAATLLYFKTQEEVISFAKERQWVVTADGKFLFAKDDNKKTDIPCDEIIKIALGYSHELEQIV